jgi:hypothetical protein
MESMERPAPAAVLALAKNRLNSSRTGPFLSPFLLDQQKKGEIKANRRAPAVSLNFEDKFLWASKRKRKLCDPQGTCGEQNFKDKSLWASKRKWKQCEPLRSGGEP